MSTYSLIHYSLTVFAAFMACVHLGVWVFARHERVQFWLALTFLGWVGCAFALARTSTHGSGGTLDATMWLTLAAPAALAVWSGLLMTAWRLGERPLNRWRIGVLAVAMAVGIWRLFDGLAMIRAWEAGGSTVHWEDMFNTFHAASTIPFWVITMAVCCVMLIEAFLFVRKPLGWIVAILAILSGVLVGFDVALLFRWLPDVPAMIGLAGIVFIGFASIVGANRYVQAARIARNTGGYRLIRPLSQGGMGSLHLAVRTGPAGFERHVALKRMLRPGQRSKKAEWVERFLSEARVAAQLQHPNIIAVHDLGHLPDGWFIAMEYLPGLTLSEVRKLARDKNITVPVSLIVNAGEYTCRALAYAHDRGVIHRDISPQNVMITFDGYVKVIDFGIAKAARGHLEGDAVDDAEGNEVGGQTVTPDLTADGHVIGKAAYLPPERLSGEAADEGTDLYALAIVLYELLCGQRPFSGGADARARLQAMLDERFTAPNVIRPDTPASLTHLIARCLRRKPADRYPDAASLGEALHAVGAQLPPLDPGRWLRETFPQRWEQEQRSLGGLPVTRKESAPEARLEGDTTLLQSETPTGTTAPSPEPQVDLNDDAKVADLEGER